MLKSTDAGRAVFQPISSLARSMRDAALLIGGGLARTPKLWRRLGDFSLLLALAGSTILVLNHTSGAAPKAWYYMSGGYGGGSQYDSDGDGIPDGQDRCPLVAGDAGCVGCPTALCATTFLIVRSSASASLGCDWMGYGTDSTVFLNYPSSGYGMPDEGTVAQGDVRISFLLAGGAGAWTSVNVYDPDGNYRGSYSGYPYCVGDVEAVTWTVSAQTFNQWRQSGMPYRVAASTNNWCGSDCTTNARLRFEFPGTMQPTSGSDADGDGVPLEQDRCPLVPGNCFGCPESDVSDTDGDGARDCFDDDDDNDGVTDWNDRCPLAFGSGSCLGCPESLCQGTQPVTPDLGLQYLDADWWGYGQQDYPSTRYYGLAAAPPAAGPATLTIYANPGNDGWYGANSVINVDIYDSADNYYGYRQFSGGCWEEQASDWQVDAATLNSLRAAGGYFRLQVVNRSAGCSPYVGVRLAYDSLRQPQAGSDDDGDGYPIEVDRCPTLPGECQGCPCTDTDGDGQPDSTDPDDDNDGVYDEFDSFPTDPLESADADGDGTGNNADPDDDNDGFYDEFDAFPTDPSESADADGDGTGNNADPDDDNDGAADIDDGCPNDPSKTSPGACGCGTVDSDADADGVADCIDNCPTTSNPGQSDFDGDGFGDACDPDWTDCNLNGIADASDLASAFSADCNGNGIPDECEDGSVRRSTGDMGGVYTSPTPREATGQLTNLPIAGGLVSLTIRAKADLDANNESLTLFLADPKNPVAVLFGLNSPACGEMNIAEFTFTAAEWNAFRDVPGGDSVTVSLQPSFAVGAVCDGNGTGPIEGYTEVIVEYLDAVPDCNSNGVWDACETDSDGDGTIDDCDGCPNNPNSQTPGVCGCNTPDTDSDGDGEADCIDLDDDNDAVNDDLDAFPLDPNESSDSDLDGQGNNADLDDDNDGIADVSDAFPLDAGESADADGDGTGDNADPDDDNDGAEDSVDGCPLDGAKLEPGQCGCGTPDTDTDDDGTADCLESPFGTVGGWGYNEYGPLDVPANLPPVRQISAGYQHTLALLDNGTMAAWGLNGRGQCDVPEGLSDVVSVAGGRDHSLALKQDGSVVAWGSNEFGQSTVPAGLSSVAKIAAGGDHSLALRQDGSLVAWGRNNYGQCDVPSDHAPFLDVAGGYSHTMAIRSDGTVVCWGDNISEQCNVPAGLGNVVSVAAGGSHSIALTSGGTVVCWGPGNPTTEVPADLAGVTQISAGTGHSVALKSDGSVVCWGYNFEGQCTVPDDVQICLQVSAGNSHTIVLQADCNHDEVADYLQLGGNDCNQDSILDACQLDSGLIEDCNDNGLADQCEKAESIEFTTGTVGPIGAGAAVIWTMTEAPFASTDVLLSGSVRGDFDSPFESLTLKLDSVLTTVVVVNTGINTQCRETTFSLVIPAATFNAARQADGTVSARLEASVAVDPQACPGGTWVEATVAYITSTAADCNANGLIDSCELAAGLGTDQNSNGIPDDCEDPVTDCPEDLNGNGTVEGGDLAILIGAWGTLASGPDISGDGVIDGVDLAIMLSAWGTCEN